MNYYEIILAAYGWQSIAFLAMLLLLLFIEIYYYTFRFRAVGSYKIKSREMLLSTPPPISIVVPMFSEDYNYLDNTLPKILSQEGAQFEVVIVYVGSDNDFYDDLLHLKSHFNNIVTSKIQLNRQFPISVKTALNVGIKASSYEHIFFTTTDAFPISEVWVSMIARGFQRGDIVLGYCGTETVDDKFDSFFIRASRFEESLFWLSSAVKSRPYRGIRSNMGFTRSIYFGANGFNHLNMNVGEDDLFLQALFKDDNACVILSPRATVRQNNWGRMDGLIDTYRFYHSADRFYPAWARNFVAWEYSSRVLFFLFVIVGLIFLPLELKVAVLLLSLVRLAFVLGGVGSVAKRVGEKGMVGRWIFYDLLSPLFALYMRFKMVKRDKRAWR